MYVTRTPQEHRTDTYNGRTYNTRMATYTRGARGVHTPNALRRFARGRRARRRRSHSAVTRRHATSTLDDASSQGRGGAPTSASTPLPACPAAAEPRAMRAVIELDLPADHTDRGWSAPTQIAARRRPADSQTSRAVDIDEAPFSPPGRPFDRARRLRRLGRLPHDACGHPARDDTAFPAGSERARLQNRPVRGRKGRGWDRRCALRRRQGAEGRRTTQKKPSRECPRGGWKKISSRSSTRRSWWPTSGRSLKWLRRPGPTT